MSHPSTIPVGFGPMTLHYLRLERVCDDDEPVYVDEMIDLHDGPAAIARARLVGFSVRDIRQAMAAKKN